MKGYVASIGFFDGVHLGHQFLIRQVREVAMLHGISSMLITFDSHPRNVVCPTCVPQPLNTLEEKLALLRSTGVDRVEILPFTDELSRMTAYQFMRDVLMEKFDVRYLIVGYNHHFGHDEASYEDYARWGKELGIDVIQAVVLEGEKVSSSIIRKSISEGEMERVESMLGYAYSLSGKVVEGRRVGRTMGFPTANVQMTERKLLPPKGAYIVDVSVDGASLGPGMLNIGSRPTLQNGDDTSIEVHLLDFSGDLYEKTVQLHLHKRLRDERLFDSLDSLKAQLKKDAVEVEAWFSTRPVR